MASGDTDVSVCSHALTLLGSSTISSFSDGTAPASVCNVLYPKVKASTLGMYKWSFSLAKSALSKLSDAPVSEYKNQFTLPTTIINNTPFKVFSNNGVGSSPITDFEIQGAVLLSDHDAIWVDFQQTVSEASMPTYFIQLLVYQMAWHLAEPVTDQIEKSEYWKTVALGSANENLRGGYFRQAANIDSRGQSNPVIADYILTDFRN